MSNNDRDYIFHEHTTSLCSECLERVQAKIIIKNDAVYLLKHCSKHGIREELYEEDVEFFLKKKDYDKPGTASRTQTLVERGCPFDCGLCPQHDQHSCIGLIEVTSHCDLSCGVCYAGSTGGEHLDLGAIERMMDFLQDSEGHQAEILQISGGEPATHPQIIEIIEMARQKGFKYVMLNTNGLRVAEDERFAKRLARFRGGFELYLQFDSLKDETYQRVRNRSLLEVKLKALKRLAEHEVPTTLVCTIHRGLNDKELGGIIEFGLREKCVRGINFQPFARFGRYDESLAQKRITLTGVIREIEKQTKGMLIKQDFVPLPCNVERVAITYLFRKGAGFVPITRNAKIKDYLPLINNTFLFTLEDMLRTTGRAVFEVEKWGCCLDFVKDFKKFIPINLFLKSEQERMEFVDQNTFRISVTSFVDAGNFDMKSMQKECVHVVTEDLRRIPFSAYNLFYRGR